MRVCVIVNKSGGVLAPSETFLRSHIEGLGGLCLVGNPGLRRKGADGGPYLRSQAWAARAVRFLLRAGPMDSLSKQDSRAVGGFLRSEGVDAVLSEYATTSITVLDACARAGVPHVAHFHGWDAYVVPEEPGMREQFVRLFREAQGFVAVSKHMSEHLVELGAPADRVFWNPCGTAIRRDRLAEPERSSPVFAAVGRMVPKKAPLLTLLAFARVREQLVNARLVFIGDGPLIDLARELARGLGIAEAVDFLGATGHDEVFELLTRARCFVQHSIVAPNGDREGTPVAVLEAMAVGLPVVATRHTGIQDVVQDGITGRLVGEYDVEAMAEAMLEFGRDASKASTFGSAGRRAVEERWSEQASLERLRKILRSVATESGATAIDRLRMA